MNYPPDRRKQVEEWMELYVAEYHKKYLVMIEKLKQQNKDANEFILDIANLLKMDADSVGLDDLQFSIDDFKDAISALSTN